MITTPVMLISTIMYMEYTKEKKNKSKQKNKNLWSFLKNNKKQVSVIIFLNALMLMFGYLGEKQIINLYLSNTIGFIFFGLSFYIIYKEYAYTENTTEINKTLFNVMFVIWGLYGISALFPILYKNIGYNILDIFSKNFYGLFIYYNILTLNNVV